MDNKTQEIFDAIDEGDFNRVQLTLIIINYEYNKTLLMIMCKTMTKSNELNGILAVNAFLEKGAVIGHKDVYGKTAVDYAKSNGLKLIKHY